MRTGNPAGPDTRSYTCVPCREKNSRPLRFGRIGKPVCFFWHDNLEPRPPAGLSGLSDRDTGNVENFPGNGQSEPGVLPKPSCEDLFLVLLRHTAAIVFTHNDPMPVACFKREPDGRGPAPMPQGIIYQVKKDLDDQRVSEYFGAGGKIVFERDLSERGTLYRTIHEGVKVLPERSMYTDLLVFFGEPDHGSNPAACLHDMGEMVFKRGIGHGHVQQIDIPVQYLELVVDVMAGDA